MQDAWREVEEAADEVGVMIAKLEEGGGDVTAGDGGVKGGPLLMFRLNCMPTSANRIKTF